MWDVISTLLSSRGYRPWVPNDSAFLSCRRLDVTGHEPIISVEAGTTVGIWERAKSGSDAGPPPSGAEQVVPSGETGVHGASVRPAAVAMSIECRVVLPPLGEHRAWRQPFVGLCACRAHSRLVT